MSSGEPFNPQRESPGAEEKSRGLRREVSAHMPAAEKRPRAQVVRLAKEPLRAAVTEIESFIVTLLVNESEVPFGKVASQVAKFLYTRELRAGAWLVDIGLLGSGLFIPEAERELEKGAGELWEIA